MSNTESNMGARPNNGQSGTGGKGMYEQWDAEQNTQRLRHKHKRKAPNFAEKTF